MHVVASGLPSTLGTDVAPITYTVPVELSRTVTAEEHELIDSAAAQLECAGYQVGFRLESGLLLIDDTSLEELAHGLALHIAAALREIESDVAERWAAPGSSVAAVRRFELRRRVAIEHQAAAISFDLGNRSVH